MRRPKDYSYEVDFLPLLYNQIQFDLETGKSNIDNIDTLLNYTMRNAAKGHRQAIIDEQKRRQ